MCRGLRFVVSGPYIPVIINTNLGLLTIRIAEIFTSVPYILILKAPLFLSSCSPKSLRLLVFPSLPSAVSHRSL